MNQLHQLQSLLADDLHAMNTLIEESLHTPNELLNQIVHTYLQSKGKQLRPIMVLLSARLFGEVTEATLCAAAALEMLHNASLIHDDVVDETMLRRGVPTVNAGWGNHLAVLVGDFFVSNSLEVGIRTGNIQIVKALAELGKELSLGEVEQICNVREHHFDYDHYLTVISKKTASLFRHCVSVGARTNGITPDRSEPLERYGELLGLCFQIKDDILDYVGDDKIGKPTGNDLREGKVTLPLLYALHQAPDDQRRRMQQMIMEGNLTDDQIRGLITFAVEAGGIDYAFGVMRDYQRQARGFLAAYPESKWRQAFADIFDFIIERNF